jgi:hypothetical protein
LTCYFIKLSKKGIYTMNKKILLGLMAVAMSSSVFADTDTDSHDAKVTVEEVALINVDDGDVTFDITAPTTAGSTFTMPTSPSTSSYAITSNVALGGTTTRSLSAKISAIDPAFELKVSVEAPADATDSTDVALSESDTPVVTDIKNVAQSELIISYVLSLSAPAAVPAYGNHAIEVTYTLGADS